jgi:hypothetical protein
MQVTRLTLAAAALAAGALVLTGCEPADGSGGPGTFGADGLGCDSNGWGPLSGCADGSHPDLEREFRDWQRKVDQAIDEAEAEDWTDDRTVTVTWIVVRIDVTGFRECVLSLREAPPGSGDHLSRRVTTVEDCAAQRVDTVYRPAGR